MPLVLVGVLLLAFARAKKLKSTSPESAHSTIMRVMMKIASTRIDSGLFSAISRPTKGPRALLLAVASLNSRQNARPSFCSYIMQATRYLGREAVQDGAINYASDDVCNLKLDTMLLYERAIKSRLDPRRRHQHSPRTHSLPSRLTSKLINPQNMHVIQSRQFHQTSCASKSAMNLSHVTALSFRHCCR